MGDTHDSDPILQEFDLPSGTTAVSHGRGEKLSTVLGNVVSRELLSLQGIEGSSVHISIAEIGDSLALPQQLWTRFLFQWPIRDVRSISEPLDAKCSSIAPLPHRKVPQESGKLPKIPLSSDCFHETRARFRFPTGGVCSMCRYGLARVAARRRSLHYCDAVTSQDKDVIPGKEFSISTTPLRPIGRRHCRSRAITFPSRIVRPGRSCQGSLCALSRS